LSVFIAVLSLLVFVVRAEHNFAFEIFVNKNVKDHVPEFLSEMRKTFLISCTFFCCWKKMLNIFYVSETCDIVGRKKKNIPSLKQANANHQGSENDTKASLKVQSLEREEGKIVSGVFMP
jgi:hypothetical protein